MTLRVGFVPGVLPDKWAARWRERESEPLDLVVVDEADQRGVLDRAEVTFCFVRDLAEAEGLNRIPLYEEQPVVVAAKDHPVAAYDEVPLADLADEQHVLGVPAGLEMRAEQLDFPAMTVPEAIEVAAAGTGVVIVPMSVARLHHRKDVVHRPVTGLPTTQVSLAWRVVEEHPGVETFIGIVRGRTTQSSRGEPSASGAGSTGSRSGAKPVRRAQPSRKPDRAGRRSGGRTGGGSGGRGGARGGGGRRGRGSR